MKILVTGGAGFIGTNLIIKLLELGHDIVSIDNYTTGSEKNHQIGVKYISEDIRHVKIFERYGQFDCVFHMAAIARIQPSFKNPVQYFETNANGTLNLCEYCKRYNIPLIYAGSSSHHSGKFKNPYTFSKDIGEEIVELYRIHYGLKSSTARFYNVYGPYHLKKGGYCTLIGSWENMIENNKPLIIYGDGNKKRDFTHVNDIVDGLIRIMQKEKWGYTFELGRGKNYSVNEIADMFGKEKIYEEDKPGEALVTLCESLLAKEVLEWEPRHNIKDYIDSYLKS